MKPDEKSTSSSESAVERNGAGGPIRKNSSDYAAYVVLAVAVAVFIVSGIFTALYLKRSAFVPGTSISEWFEDLERQGKDLLDRFSGETISTQDPAQQAKRHLRKGHQLFTTNRVNEALDEFEKAVRSDPANPDAYYWRGRALIRLKQYDKALEDFRGVIGLKTDYREAHDNLAWLYERKKNYDQALFHLNKSIQMGQDNAWAYYHRAMILYGKGELGKALEDAKRACDLKSQDGCKLYEEYKRIHDKLGRS
jgi:tetratricopeptide (TPR) repeat protein